MIFSCGISLALKPGLLKQSAALSPQEVQATSVPSAAPSKPATVSIPTEVATRDQAEDLRKALEDAPPISIPKGSDLERMLLEGGGAGNPSPLAHGSP